MSGYESDVSVETGASTIGPGSLDQNTIMGTQAASERAEDTSNEADIGEDTVLPQANTNGNGDDDPLEVKSLALEFDYLMYKIQDRVKTLSEQTRESVTSQKQSYEGDIERVNGNLEQIYNLVRECDSLENEFVKIEQLSQIAHDFSVRLTDVERRLAQRRRR